MLGRPHPVRPVKLRSTAPRSTGPVSLR
jgi:hypothetical protein